MQQAALGKSKRFMFAGGKETDLGRKIGLHLLSRAQINSLERTHVGTKVNYWSYLTLENTCLRYIPYILNVWPYITENVCFLVHWIVPKQFVRRNLFAVLLVGSNFVYLKHLHRTGNWSEQIFSVIQVSAQSSTATCLLYYDCIKHPFPASWTNAPSFTDSFLILQTNPRPSFFLS